MLPMVLLSLSSKSVTALLLVLFLAYLPGCQLNGDLRQEGLDNAAFMSMWQIYTRCVTSSDLHSTQQDSSQLRTLSHAEEGSVGMNSKLPNPRLAVDLKAMAASCTLHAGDIAAISGRSDTARDMFIAVLSEHSEPLYAYYAEQARTRLIKLEAELQASLRLSSS
jgi:hypothetical protein